MEGKRFSHARWLSGGPGIATVMGTVSVRGEDAFARLGGNQLWRGTKPVVRRGLNPSSNCVKLRLTKNVRRAIAKAPWPWWEGRPTLRREQVVLLCSKRADTENVFDELKNQRDFRGFCSRRNVVTEAARLEHPRSGPRQPSQHRPRL